MITSSWGVQPLDGETVGWVGVAPGDGVGDGEGDVVDEPGGLSPAGRVVALYRVSMAPDRLVPRATLFCVPTMT